MVTEWNEELGMPPTQILCQIVPQDDGCFYVNLWLSLDMSHLQKSGFVPDIGSIENPHLYNTL